MDGKQPNAGVEVDALVPGLPAAPPASARRADRDSFLHDLLTRTSRTFALSIPQLPQPTLREVTIAYLLFRIADTLEDASVLWSRRQQLAALAEFEDLLRDPSQTSAESLCGKWLEEPPSDHAGYLWLLREMPAVVRELLDLSPEAQQSILKHTVRTTQRMALFVEQTDEGGFLQLDSVAALQAYCYAVAGIVGELLTELFILGSSNLRSIEDYLNARAARFGEGLQLVNILKDSAADASERRSYLPTGVERSDVFALARADLNAAAEYCLEIQRAGGPDGVVSFTALPVELAWATLDTVEKKGPGAKISRATVFRLYNRLHRALAAKRPALEVRAG